MKIKTYTLSEMQTLLTNLRGIYDAARVVDPAACREIVFQEETEGIRYGAPCYSIWGTLERCTNCTSFDASTHARRFTKEDILQGEPVGIQSIPVCLAMKDGSTRECVVETICKSEGTEGVMNALISRYTLVFEVDLLRDRSRLVYSADSQATMGLPAGGVYSELNEQYCRERLDNGLAEWRIQQGSIPNIVKRLSEDDSFEICYSVGQGKWRAVEFRVSTRDDEGNPTCALICFKKLDDDRTVIHRLHKERDRALEVLEIALKEARQANDAKTAFLSNMSHDIRTPMNAIMGFTRLALDEGATEDEVREYLEKIQISGTHMLGLINKVLDLVRIESGRVLLEHRTENLPAVVREVGTIMLPLAEARNQTFTVDTSGLVDSKVLVDRQRLTQVLTNLVQNAIKFTPEGGRISLKATQKACQIPGYGAFVFSVEDNGCGISEEFRKRAFEPFEQEKNPFSGTNEGNGLGLSIVRQLVSLAGGTIRVESEPGKGSVFSVYVELALPDSDGVDEASFDNGDIPHVDYAGKRFLIVEDNALNRMIMKKMAEKAGVEVEEATDGAMAIQMIEEREPGWYDCVLMDIRMPEMDGLEATRRIRSIPDVNKAATPVVGVSANAFTEDRENARQAGMNGYVAKPVSMEQLKFVLDCIFSGIPVPGAADKSRTGRME